jgi:hypothetical protein
MMKNTIIILVLTCWGCIPSSDFPQIGISNELIRAKLYLPDLEKGYYQSTRFDWSGVIPLLEYKGHTYFGQWFETYDPKKHDAICGPVEEFGVIGYEKAKVGGEFLKIGIGFLRKPSEEKYNPFTYYEIVNPGEWKVKGTDSQVEFTHRLTNISGYSYVYKKTVCLIKDKPIMVIKHRLKNIGRQAIETTVYNHHFFTIDNQFTGPGTIVKFPFDLQGTGKGIGDLAKLQGKQIIFLRQLTKKDKVYIENLQGFENLPNNYEFRIENHDTRAGVRVTCDRPISKLVFWACSTTSCPEPYIKIHVDPLQEFTWEYVYELYEL